MSWLEGRGNDTPNTHAKPMTRIIQKTVSRQVKLGPLINKSISLLSWPVNLDDRILNAQVYRGRPTRRIRVRFTTAARVQKFPRIFSAFGLDHFFIFFIVVVLSVLLFFF